VTAPYSHLFPGEHTRQLTVDRRERSYVVHVPEAATPPAAWPVVLAFHGGGTNAETMIRFSGLSQKADTAGFVAVYPNGSGRLPRALTFNGGNCCGHALRHGVDDVKFVGELLDDLATVLPVDERRVFATGMSNGAMLCYLLAGQMADRIAAIAPVAGPMGTPSCSPARPVPVVHFHGTADEFAPYNGGRGRRSRTGVKFFSVEHTVSTWVKANGANPRPAVTQLPLKYVDGTRVTRTQYGAGHGSAEVVLYTIHEGGHTWPGRETPLKFLGKATLNISANDLMWTFFQRHPLM
jgi:polyhydroxybutyrate depolymerase